MSIPDKMVRVVMNVLILVEVVLLLNLFLSTAINSAATVATATGTFNNIHHFCRGSCPATTTTSTATAPSGSMVPATITTIPVQEQKEAINADISQFRDEKKKIQDSMQP